MNVNKFDYNIEQNKKCYSVCGYSKNWYKIYKVFLFENDAIKHLNLINQIIKKYNYYQTIETSEIDPIQNYCDEIDVLYNDDYFIEQFFEIKESLIDL